MAAAEPPPRPLYSATICGMSVIATRLPDIQASADADQHAPRDQRQVVQARHAPKKVATVAISMPAPAHWMPLRAVTGDAMRLMPRMNSSAATK